MRHAIILVAVAMMAHVFACQSTQSNAREGDRDSSIPGTASEQRGGLSKDSEPGGRGSRQAPSMNMETNLACRLDTVGSAVPGQPVKLRFTLQNASSSPVFVLRWYTPLEGIRGDILRVVRDGQEVSYQGPMIKRGTPTRDDYIEIPADDSVSVVVDLSRAYDCSVPGDYHVRLRSGIRDYSRDASVIPKSPDSHVPMALDCREVVVRVTTP